MFFCVAKATDEVSEEMLPRHCSEIRNSNSSVVKMLVEEVKLSSIKWTSDWGSGQRDSLRERGTHEIRSEERRRNADVEKDKKKTKEAIMELCGGGGGGGGGAQLLGGGGGGSRLPLLNKQRLIVRQEVPLSCSAGSALIKPSTPPTLRPSTPGLGASMLHATADC